VFRELKRHRRGLLRADLLEHTLTFEAALSAHPNSPALRQSEFRRAVGPAAMREADVVALQSGQGPIQSRH
jgi:hypothetical protein